MNIERERGKCKYPLLFQTVESEQNCFEKQDYFGSIGEVIQINH